MKKIIMCAVTLLTFSFGQIQPSGAASERHYEPYPADLPSGVLSSKVTYGPHYPIKSMLNSTDLPVIVVGKNLNDKRSATIILPGKTKPLSADFEVIQGVYTIDLNKAATVANRGTGTSAIQGEGIYASDKGAYSHGKPKNDDEEPFTDLTKYNFAFPDYKIEYRKGEGFFIIPILYSK